MVRQELIPVKFGEWLTEYLDLLENYLQQYSTDEDHDLYSFYTNILRKSFLLACYSSLEHELEDYVFGCKEKFNEM